MSTLHDLWSLSIGQQRTLYSIDCILRRHGHDGASDLIPRSQLEQDTGMSSRGVKHALDALVARGLVKRQYECVHCGVSFGEDYGAVTWMRCPICGRRRHNAIWARLKLSTGGQALASQIVFMSIQQEIDRTLPPSAELYLQRVVRIIEVISPRQTNELRDYLHYEWDKHSYETWVLALMRVNRERLLHPGCPVFSARGLLRWALKVNDEGPSPKNDLEMHAAHLETRVEYALERVEVLEGVETVESDRERLCFVDVVTTICMDNPNLTPMLREMVKARGRNAITLELLPTREEEFTRRLTEWGQFVLEQPMDLPQRKRA